MKWNENEKKQEKRTEECVYFFTSSWPILKIKSLTYNLCVYVCVWFSLISSKLKQDYLICFHNDGVFAKYLSWYSVNSSTLYKYSLYSLL